MKNENSILIICTLSKLCGSYDVIILKSLKHCYQGLLITQNSQLNAYALSQKTVHLWYLKLDVTSVTGINKRTHVPYIIQIKHGHTHYSITLNVLQ
jgi:hypothetical protein